MTELLAKNTKNWKIRTNVGFVPFVGVAHMGRKPIYKITFEDNTFIDVTDTHTFFTLDGREITTRELSPGITLMGIENKTISSVEPAGEEETFDIVESETHTFFANGLLCHNCEFLSSDPLLIDTLVLANLTNSVKDQQPVAIMGDILFFKQPQKNSIYLVGMDPATGRGHDYTTITAFEFPSMEQVAQFRSNTTSTVDAYQNLKRLLKVFEKTQSTVYYSVENNGVGEGIIALLQNDESPPETAEFVSQSNRQKEGMVTTKQAKMKACLTLKEMIERDKIKIKSPLIIQELKNYVRKGGSYAGKIGSTDDLVSSLLIVVRLLEEISSFEQEAYDKLYSSSYFNVNDEFDENDIPPAIVF